MKNIVDFVWVHADLVTLVCRLWTLGGHVSLICAT